MARYLIGFWIVMSLMLWAKPFAASADTPSPTLVIAQIKITSSNGQFVTLYNASDSTLDLGKYQIEYFNNFDLAKSSSSRLLALSGTLPAHGYYMISDDGQLMCYQMTVYSVTLGFSSTAGMIQIISKSQSSPGSSVIVGLQDYVSWSKAATAGVQTLPSALGASLLRQPVQQSAPSVIAPGSGSWLAVQPDASNACNLVSVATPTVKPEAPAQNTTLVVSPPSVVIASQETIVDAIVDNNVGLATPQITEILPNPTGTGNDSSDEFIELYNPNNTTFNLTGYSLQVGTAALHSYSFAPGTILNPLSFTVFYSKLTGLTLSNTGGQAKLISSKNEVVSQTAVYDVAKDGQAWALVNDKWNWTTIPTPGTINLIAKPVASSSATKAASSLASVTPTKSSKTLESASSKATTSTNLTTASSPIHTWTLALVAGLALLYGAYEYRTDLGNRIHKLRQHLRDRRVDWSPVTWWRSYRANQRPWRRQNIVSQRPS